MYKNKSILENDLKTAKYMLKYWQDKTGDFWAGCLGKTRKEIIRLWQARVNEIQSQLDKLVNKQEA